MGGKRTRSDIIGDMLSSIIEREGRIKPTHLMYRSNMSHGQMKAYLNDLIAKELIKKIKKGSHEYITITDNGFEFIQKLREIKEFEKAFGL